MANGAYLDDLKKAQAAVQAAVETAKEVQQTTDKSRELALATTKFEEGLMWLEKHIAQSK